MTFDRDQKLLCITADPEGILKKGRTYTVYSTPMPGHVTLREALGPWPMGWFSELT